MSKTWRPGCLVELPLDACHSYNRDFSIAAKLTVENISLPYMYHSNQPKSVTNLIHLQGRLHVPFLTYVHLVTMYICIMLQWRAGDDASLSSDVTRPHTMSTHGCCRVITPPPADSQGIVTPLDEGLREDAPLYHVWPSKVKNRSVAMEPYRLNSSCWRRGF
jgi:hypothetical protein